jgi:hypothetical protein
VAARIELPFSTDIPVRSYLNQAFPLSVVSRNPSHERALLGSFIQLFFPQEKLEYDRVLMLPGLFIEDWERLGFLETVCVNVCSGGQPDPKELLKTLVERLDSGWYADIWIDEFFLPERSSFKRVHSVHDNFIVGYDLSQQQFLIAGYASDYQVLPAGFDETLKAFYHAPWTQAHKRWLRFVTVREDASRAFDIHGVITQLGEYIHSSPSLSEDAMREANLYWKARRFAGVWGLDTHYAFGEYFKAAGLQHKALDLRATRTLWEHKACMLKRLRFLEGNGYCPLNRGFSNAYVAIQELAKTLRFVAYEYNACGLEPRHLEKMSRILADLRDSEAIILGGVYAALRSVVQQLSPERDVEPAEQLRH